MNGLVVRVERAGEGEQPGYVLGVRITRMDHGDRALYLQYIGANGWERVSAGGGGA